MIKQRPIKNLLEICRSYRWVYFALLIALLTSICFDRLYHSNRLASFDISNFKSEVISQKILLDNETVSCAKLIENNPNDIWNNLATSTNSGRNFLVFKDSTLVAWTSQLLPIGEMGVDDFYGSVVRLSNGWYLCSHKIVGQKTIVGLLQIKNAFHYQNKYLVNEFCQPFNLPSSIDILADSNDSYLPILDAKGNFMMSLVIPEAIYEGDFYALISVISLILTLVLAAFIISRWFRKTISTSLKQIAWWCLVFVCLILYVFLFVSSSYQPLLTMDLFLPVQFAYSGWLSSLGSFVGATILLAWLTYLFCRYYPLKRPRYLYFELAIFFTIMVAWLLLIRLSVFILTEHSTEVFLFRRIVNLKDTHFLVWLGIFLLLFCAAMWFDSILKRFLTGVSKLVFLLWALLFMMLYALLSLAVFETVDYYGIGFFITLLIFGIYNRSKETFSFGYRHILWLVLIFDVYAMTLWFHYNTSKEIEDRSFLVETLSNKLIGEQDAVAEMYMTSGESKIANDPNILDMVADRLQLEDDLRDYLIKNYFMGYLDRFDIQVVACWPKLELFVEGIEQTADCYKYFDDMIHHYGQPVFGSDHFYFMKKDNGLINYFAVFKYNKNIPNLETTLFIEFTSKLFFEGLGYPELLISNEDNAQFELHNSFSYAKYIDGRLTKRNGPYLYHVSSHRFGKQNVSEKSLVYENNYSHLIYTPKVGTQIVMSYPAVGVSNVLIAFSVIYILFLIAAFSILFLSRWGHRRSKVTYSIRERIQISLVGFSLLLLLVIGSGSIVYAMHQYKGKNYDMLSQRIKSVMMEMGQKVGAEKKLNSDMTEYLNFLLQTFSNVFYTDINLYGLDGKLIATSRAELFDKGVMGNYINPLAYKALVVDEEREYIHNESIGKLDYISAYVPFLNSNNEVLAYLNIPYFVGHNELQEEVSSILVAMMNAYLIIILVAIGIAFWASRQITRPLLVVQQRLSQTRLGLQNEKIQYARPDEIGHLVDEYNRMVDELAQSADKLAKNERELAWREMAKQIAHEIKNPLTPMLLSVQYLQKAWDDKVPDFDKFIHRVTKTLVDHIQQLSIIATEFSHFAKMPAAHIEKIDFVDKIVNTVALYEKSNNVLFTLSLPDPGSVIINMDKEQLLSVLNNLLKNAIQSIDRQKKAKINIVLTTNATEAIFSIADNGAGIPDAIKTKLFMPNFTTKSSGMGLGLAISKNIIDEAGGQIWFDTQIGKGSVFYVRLPLALS